MKKQYQIVQIQNGWLVSFVDDGEARMAAVQQQQIQPRNEYCKDLNAVCALLKREWPTD